MDFKFTIGDFLNDFGSGFVLLSGLVITNYKKVLPELEKLTNFNEFNFFNIPLMIIFIYIVGLALSALTNFLEQDFYLFFDRLIKKTYKKEPKNTKEKIINIINKPLNCIKTVTLFYFFRKWASLETIMKMRNGFNYFEKERKPLNEKNMILHKKYRIVNNIVKKYIIKVRIIFTIKKLRGLREKYKDHCVRHSGMQFVQWKSNEEIYQLEKIGKEVNSSFDKHYWYKSQFWQISSNAVLIIYILNLFVFKSIDFYKVHEINLSHWEFFVPFFSVSTIVYLSIFFLGKSMSPMYIKMWLRQISREMSAINMDRESLVKDFGKPKLGNNQRVMQRWVRRRLVEKLLSELYPHVYPK
jgi:hypothetical protein